MKIFLLLSLIILTIFFILKKVFYFTKRNLFKDQAEWFSKEINIKYNKSKEISVLNNYDNYLKLIADESKCYLEEQSKQDQE